MALDSVKLTDCEAVAEAFCAFTATEKLTIAIAIRIITFFILFVFVCLSVCSLTQRWGYERPVSKFSAPFNPLLGTA